MVARNARRPSMSRISQLVERLISAINKLGKRVGRDPFGHYGLNR